MLWFIKQRKMQWSNSQIEWKSTASHFILRELVFNRFVEVKKKEVEFLLNHETSTFNLAYHNGGLFFGNIMWFKFVMQVARKLISNVPYFNVWIERWHAFWCCCFRQTFAFRWSSSVRNTTHIYKSDGQGALLWANYIKYMYRYIEKEASRNLCRYVQQCMLVDVCHFGIITTIEYIYWMRFDVMLCCMLWCDERVRACLCVARCRHLWAFAHVFIFKMKC